MVHLSRQRLPFAAGRLAGANRHPPGLTTTAETFLLRADLDAFEGETRVFCQSWDRRIPRAHI